MEKLTFLTSDYIYLLTSDVVKVGPGVNISFQSDGWPEGLLTSLAPSVQATVQVDTAESTISLDANPTKPHIFRPAPDRRENKLS